MRIGALLLWAQLSTSAVVSSQLSLAPPPAPGRLVDVGGWRMHVNCSGEKRPGQPTVILEAGSSDSSVEWSLVQSEVARFARVCSYDRSGTGWSELGPTPHTDRQIVYELGALLDASDEKPPYVLVGHSIGGRYVRLFAVARPADVAGVILVDSNHEDDLLFINGELRRVWATATGRRVPPPKKGPPLKWEDIPAPVRAQLEAATRPYDDRPPGPPFDRLPPEAQRARKWMHSQPTWMAANNSPFAAEEVAEMKAERQKNPQPLGDKPLIVLTRGKPITGDHADEREESHKRNQADLVTLSRRGKQVIAAQSGHHIQIDEPELVEKAIREVVSLAPPTAGRPEQIERVELGRLDLLRGQRADTVRLIYDQAHGEQPLPGPMDAIAKKLGLEIQTSAQAINAEALKGVRILYLRAPSEAFAAAEKEAIVAFVKGGGSLLLVLDEERRQSLEKTGVNNFIAPFGMRLTPDTEYLHNCGGIAKAGEINKVDRELPFSGGRAVEGGTAFAFQLDKDGKPAQPFGAYKRLDNGARIVVLGEGMATMFLGDPNGVRLTGVPKDPTKTIYWGKDSAIFMEELLIWLSQ